MKQKFLSVFFCALVASTLGHEYLKHHERAHHLKRHNIASVSQSRANNDQCVFVCPMPNPSDTNTSDSSIRLIVNKEVSVVAVLNVTASVALAIDIQSNLVALFNGTTGVTILIDLKSETGIRFAQGSSDKLWLVKEISFTSYLLALGSLKSIKDFPNGQSFTIKTISKQLVIEIGVIISSLDLEIAERLKINTQAAISMVLVLSKTLILTLGGKLSIILKKIESTEVIIKGGLVKLVTIFKGLAQLSSKLVGGLEALLIADIEFKLGLLLAAKSGLEVIVALFGQVASKVDLSKILGPLLKSPEAFLEIVVSLHQGLYKGIAGVEAVIYNILLLISKKVNITSFIDVIIQVSANAGSISEEKFTSVISSFVQIIQMQVARFQSSESWQVVLTFFTNLQAGKLIVGGVDISAVIKLMIESEGKVSLNLIVGILSKISTVTSLGVSLGYLYLRIMFFIVSGQGVVYALKLLPSISLNIDFTSGKSIIIQILSGASLTKILSHISSLDIVGVVTNLPVFGDIFVALGKAVESVGQKASDLQASLKGSEIVTELFGWVKYAFGLSGGTSPSGNIGGACIIGGGASVDVDISSLVSTNSSSTGESNSNGGSNANRSGSGNGSASGGWSWGSSGSWLIGSKPVRR